MRPAEPARPSRSLGAGIQSNGHLSFERLAAALRAELREELVELLAAEREATARRVVELLREDGLADPPIDAAEVARRFGVDRDWVYRNAGRLGAERLGDGPRARLRFHPERVSAYLRSTGERSQDPVPGVPTRRRPNRARRDTGQRSDLLPIRGGRLPA